MTTTTANLAILPADVLIHLFSFLSIPEILHFRQICKDIHELSKQPIVWINACKRDVISRSWPWAGADDDDDFERATRNAWKLGCRWTDESITAMVPQKQVRFATNTSTAISDVRFLDVAVSSEKLVKKMILTVSKGIWSVLTLWSIGEDDGHGVEESAAKLAEWSPKGGLFTGLAINDDVEADDRLAVSIAKDGGHETLLLSIASSKETYSLVPTHRIPTPQGASPLRPLNFVGSVLALSDDISQTVILDWKTGKMAVLVEEINGEAEGPVAGNWKHNTPIQVLFTYRSITVVRARSVSLFPEPAIARPGENVEPLNTMADEAEEEEAPPTPSLPPNAPSYTPLATHSFGWVDDIAVVPAVPSHRHLSVPGEHGAPTKPTDFRILVRAESDNPWRSDEGSLDVYTLKVNPEFVDVDASSSNDEGSGHGKQVSRARTTRGLSTEIPDHVSASTCPPPTTAPYTFPPTYLCSLSTPRGSLRCTNVRLGACGTAVWVSPTPPRTGLVVDEGVVNGVASLTDDESVTTGPEGSIESIMFNGTNLVVQDGFDVDLYGIGIGLGTGYGIFNATWGLPPTPPPPTQRTESLVAGVFPGPLLVPDAFALDSSPSLSLLNLKPRLRPVMVNDPGSGSGWTAIDYDESGGRVVLGSGDGKVRVIWL
ncbi:hypothetical protein Moror_9139 [Moniliophthora roreri MCA 2997]|uniref:F-box domain-containing protein n=1 Tax=Moniliophthora roreri (strain MCA 2997) TaxID=1381753 RepID=V2XJ00_MONRO|nr:hypothetical protein Moror_9139 [Moniliophthora roreri MCA 2997]